MIGGKIDWASGELHSIGELGAWDVEVSGIPQGFGPYAYDPVTKRAIPHAALIAQRETERVARDPERRIAALEAENAALKDRVAALETRSGT